MATRSASCRLPSLQRAQSSAVGLVLFFFFIVVLSEEIDDRIELCVDVHDADHQRPDILFVRGFHQAIVAIRRLSRKMALGDMA